MSLEVNDICQSHVTSMIDENGVHPQPGAHLDHQGNQTLYALDIKPEQIIDLAYKLCRDETITEFFVSLDCFSLPGQGVDLDSLLVIFHVRPGQKARLGVLPYSWNYGQPVMEPIDWRNKFWTGQYEDLLSRLDKVSQARGA